MREQGVLTEALIDAVMQRCSREKYSKCGVELRQRLSEHVLPTSGSSTLHCTPPSDGKSKLGAVQSDRPASRATVGWDAMPEADLSRPDQPPHFALGAICSTAAGPERVGRDEMS